MQKAIILIAVMLFLTSCVPAVQEQEQLVGGPCEYKTYVGQCRIENAEDLDSVTFSFVPDSAMDVSGTFAQNSKDLLAREYSAPYTEIKKDCTEKDIDTVPDCKLTEGEAVPCTMEVITEGTCTPVVFKFQ